jgi:hypothetical protein
MSGKVINWPIVARRPIAELHKQEVPKEPWRDQLAGSAVIIILPVIRIERYFCCGNDDGELQA